MGSKLSTDNFIRSLSGIGAVASAALDHWWVFILLLAATVGRRLWAVLAPPIAGFVTYKIWLRIDPAKAVEQAELASDRHLGTPTPEVNGNSPPRLAGDDPAPGS